jgi:hypothetical protein
MRICLVLFEDWLLVSSSYALSYSQLHELRRAGFGNLEVRGDGSDESQASAPKDIGTGRECSAKERNGAPEAGKTGTQECPASDDGEVRVIGG